MSSQAAPSGVTKDELDELAVILDDVFLQRHDLYGQQQEAGHYLCVRRPLGSEHLVGHLQGALTLGAYVLDEESHGRYLVLDADSEPDWRRVMGLAEILAEMGVTSYLERSRRGGHLWLFFEERLPGELIRRFGKGLFYYFRIEDVELFPKQDKLRQGPGSLIRLPFGVHQKSGRRYGFYGVDGRPLAGRLRDQIRLLGERERVPAALVARFAAMAPVKQWSRRDGNVAGAKGSGERDGGSLADQVRQAISVRELVEHYVELGPRGMGLCPFHDDQVASFGVNDQENFWYCFACEKGGSVIHFWMYYREIGYDEAVVQLGRKLLAE